VGRIEREFLDVLDWDVNVGEAVILALRKRKGSE
jgi:hypothetical protein